MRRLRSFTLAMAGLACALPSSAKAGFPGGDFPGAGKPRAKVLGGARPARLCADCQAKLMASSGQPAPMVISGTPTAVLASGPCTTCEGGAPVAPGYAVVGEGSPTPVLASSGGAPGHAVVGGMMASAEPIPVGVVRTNYHQGPSAPGSLEASVAANRGGAPSAAPIPHARPNEVPPSMFSPPRHRRPRVVSQLLGMPDWGRRRAEAQARSRENHAMTSYGPAAAASELPASMVYGGR